MQCTNCGNEIPDKAKVCGHCGHRLKADPGIPAQSTVVKQGIPNWAWGLGGALVTLIAGIILVWAGSSSENRSAIIQNQPDFTAMSSSTQIPTIASRASIQSCENRFLYRPFIGKFSLLNVFDHEYPTQERNKSIVTWRGERSANIGYDGHPGIDWEMPEGTPLLSAAEGWIRFAGEEVEPECLGSPPCPAGNVPCKTVVKRVIVDTRSHGKDGAWEGYLIAYYHLSQIDVAEDQKVQVGQQIGLSGQTGCASSPHLHFQVLWSDANGNWSAVDPFGWSGSVDIPLDPWASNPSGAVSCYLWLDEP